MPILAGADGCPGGWICVTLDTLMNRTGHARYGDAASLMLQSPRPLVLTIDIPIGLSDAGPRACDTAARALLGAPRCRSVFPSPIRPAIRAPDRLKASAITKGADGRLVGVQSWAIYPKIREVDAAISPSIQQWCVEVHPEVCFRAWNGNMAMPYSKKTSQGRAAREALITGTFGATARAEVRTAYARGLVSDDDINDAFAALWTARRIAAGTAVTIPPVPPLDAAGLRMEMRY